MSYLQPTNTTAKTVDFQGYQAIRQAADQGSSFPTSPTPVTGQWFYHTTIKTLFQYEGSWKPIVSFGDMNLYIDKTNGSDAAGQGYSATTGAVKTWSYAFGLIPSVFGGNVNIYVTGETYTETATLQGKNPAGPYSITIQGTLTVIESLSCAAGCTQGRWTALAPAKQEYARIIRSSGTWTANQRQDKYLKFTSGVNNGESLLIDYNDTTAAVLAGSFLGGAPSAGDTFDIVSPATSISDFRIGAGQRSVVLKDITLAFANGTNRTLYGAFIECTFYRCMFPYSSGSSIWTSTSNSIVNYSCYFKNCRYFIRAASKVTNSACKHYIGAVLPACIAIDEHSTFYVGDGTIIDCNSVANSKGIIYVGIATTNGNGGFQTAPQINIVRRCAIGVSSGMLGSNAGFNPTYTLPGDGYILPYLTQPTSLSTGKLVDTNATFVTWGIQVGDKVVNISSANPNFALVSSVDSETQLTLSADIFTNTNQGYKIVKAASFNTLDIYNSFDVSLTTTLTSNTILNYSHHTVLVSGNITITLPSAVGLGGRKYVVKKIDTGTTTTIATTSAQTIDGAAPVALTVQWSIRSYTSDGANWVITNSYL